MNIFFGIDDVEKVCDEGKHCRSKDHHVNLNGFRRLLVQSERLDEVKYSFRGRYTNSVLVVKTFRSKLHNMNRSSHQQVISPQTKDNYFY